jgi:hypothetical protein
MRGCSDTHLPQFGDELTTASFKDVMDIKPLVGRVLQQWCVTAALVDTLPESSSPVAPSVA